MGKNFYKICEEFGIKYEMCGKLIISSKKEQQEALNVLYHRGKKMGFKV